MGNLGLTAVAITDTGKKATLDANATILDEAFSDPFTADLTSGDVTLTNAEFRNNIKFLGANVATTGRKITIPNIAKGFFLEAASGNSDPFDLVKGTTTISVTPGTVAIFLSGSGANDLSRIGVEGGGAAVIQSKSEYLEIGFDGPGDATRNSLWATADSAEHAMAFPTIYHDTVGLDLSIATDGTLQIPTGSGIKGIRLYFKRTIDNPGANDGIALRMWRPVGENGTGDETDLFFQPTNLLRHRSRTFPDQTESKLLAAAQIRVHERVKPAFWYFNGLSGGLPVQPLNDLNQSGDRVIIEIAERAAPNGLRQGLRAYRLGTPAANEVLLSEPIVRPIRLQDAFAGSYARCGTNPSSATVFDINVTLGAITAKLGQVSFSTGGVATFSYVSDTAVTLTNPGFETGDLTGWTTLHGSGGVASGTNPRSGSFAFRVGGLSNHGIYQDVSTPGGADDNLIDMGLRSALLGYWTDFNSTIGKDWCAHMPMFDAAGEPTNGAADYLDPEPVANSVTATFVHKTFLRPVPKLTRTMRAGFECISVGTSSGDMDDITLDLTCTDVILRQGMVLDITAPGALNGIADVAITLAGRLV